MKNNFNIFREYVKQLMDYGKKFIIIGNQNAITYKEIFPYIKNNELWLGVSMNGANRWFYAPDNYEVKENAAGYKVENGRKMFFVNGVVWFTNISNEKRNKKLDLIRRYSNEYPKYDNYDAIEVSRVENIPMDYDGVMGVPISFLHKYNPEQFEIVGCTESEGKGFSNGLWDEKSGVAQPLVSQKRVYKRIFIKKVSAFVNEHKMDYGKKFLVIGSMNAITYKEIFPYIKGDMLWWGHSIHSGDRKFYVPENYPLDAAGCGVDENGRRFIRVKGVRWFTNVTNKSRNTPLDLYKRYSNEYPKYDNYDAIEVGKTCDIPMDYNGVMGVPITFLDKYCPEQFEILDMNPHFFTLVEQGFEKPKQLSLKSYGMKDPYARILIRKRTA